jgi:hypothetical protein
MSDMTTLTLPVSLLDRLKDFGEAKYGTSTVPHYIVLNDLLDNHDDN